MSRSSPLIQDGRVALSHCGHRVNVAEHGMRVSTAASKFVSAIPVSTAGMPVAVVTATPVRASYVYATPTTTATATRAPADACATCLYDAKPTLLINGHDGFHADGHKNENCKLRNSAKVPQILVQADIRNGQVGD